MRCAKSCPTQFHYQLSQILLIHSPLTALLGEIKGIYKRYTQVARDLISVFFYLQHTFLFITSIKLPTSKIQRPTLFSLLTNLAYRSLKMVVLTRVCVLLIATVAIGVEASKVGHIIQGTVSSVIKVRGQNSLWERGKPLAPLLKIRTAADKVQMRA